MSEGQIRMRRARRCSRFILRRLSHIGLQVDNILWLFLSLVLNPLLFLELLLFLRFLVLSRLLLLLCIYHVYDRS